MTWLRALRNSRFCTGLRGVLAAATSMEDEGKKEDAIDGKTEDRHKHVRRDKNSNCVIVTGRLRPAAPIEDNRSHLNGGPCCEDCGVRDLTRIDALRVSRSLLSLFLLPLFL